MRRRKPAPVVAESVPLDAFDKAMSFALRFRGQANFLAMQFGGPVYLVGSMLTSLWPGDIDLRIQLDRVDLVTMFGEEWDDGTLWSPGKLLKHREELKQSRRMTRHWRGAFGPQRFDIQFQCALFSDVDGLPIFDDRPRARLDTVPLDYFTAGRGDP